MRKDETEHWTTKSEIRYLNSIGTHTKRGNNPAFRVQCLRGYVAALRKYKRRWDPGVDGEAVRVHAEALLFGAI